MRELEARIYVKKGEKGPYLQFDAGLAEALFRYWGAGEVRVKMRKGGRQKNTEQLGYYFGVCIRDIQVALYELGTELTNEGVHELVKLEVLGPVRVKLGPHVREIAPSIADYSVAEMAEYIDRVIEWAATTLSIEIPPPVKKSW